MTHKAILEPEGCALVVIDLQEKLVPMVRGSTGMTLQATMMLKGAAIYDIPVIYTEHYPKGLGRTIPGIREFLSEARGYEKVVFSAFGSTEFRTALEELGARTLIIMGIESHICVSQTVHDARDLGYAVHVPEDAISSRRGSDHLVGLQKMRDAGAVITSVETALYEMQYRAGDARFRQLLGVVKSAEEDRSAGELVKIVIYVPANHADAVRGALGESGAGAIGNYDLCSFSQRGVGRFRPGEGTNPYLGSRGEIEFVEEERIETVCPRRLASRVIEHVRRVHPYEEMAYDIYPLLGPDELL